jgi:hypothetical protein
MRRDHQPVGRLLAVYPVFQGVVAGKPGIVPAEGIVQIEIFFLGN